MRNILCIFVLACLSAAACGLTELGESPHSNQDGIWTGPPVKDASVYVTAFDYPDGYDWRSDPERGTGRCSLVVLAGSVPVLKIPVGDVHKVSPEPSRHRIIDGHLYTDYSDSLGTVIKKDGKEVVSYDSAEEIVCMTESRGSIHTLGLSHDGGFCYRVDGHPVLERESGRVFRHLEMNDGKASFCFSQPVASSEGISQRYYSAVGGKTSVIELDTLVTDVWDLKFHDGVLCGIVSVKDGAPVELFIGEERSDIYRFTMNPMVTCSFTDFESLSVSGVYSGPIYPVNPYLWTKRNGAMYLSFGCSLSALSVTQWGVSYAINPMTSANGVIICLKKFFRMPDGYSVMGGNAMVQTDSTTVCLGLSSREGGRPVLWRNVGETDTLDINGYIATVSAAVPR